MAYIVVCIVSLFAAALTLFSGFGLGSILLPVFAFFFPIEMAVAATAVVHLLNNIFKVGLLGRHADWRVVAAFSIPGAVAAFGGALILNLVSGLRPVAVYSIGTSEHFITPVALVIAVMMVFFAIFELHPRLQALSFERRYLPLGGLASGFVGGVSGHQGALRAAFLIKAGLNKESFLGTSVVSAVIVDVSRLLVYGLTFFSRDFEIMSAMGGAGLLVAATAAAFVGSFAGTRLIEKVTLNMVKYIVGVMLLLIAISLGSGLI